MDSKISTEVGASDIAAGYARDLYESADGGRKVADAFDLAFLIRAVRSEGALVRYDDVADLLVGFNEMEQGERIQKMLEGTEAGRD